MTFSLVSGTSLAFQGNRECVALGFEPVNLLSREFVLG
jgi:hypothetical protein